MTTLHSLRHCYRRVPSRAAVFLTDLLNRKRSCQPVPDKAKQGYWVLLTANLLNLRHVSVLGDTVAVDALSNLCVQQILLGTSACSTDSRLGIYDYVVF